MRCDWCLKLINGLDVKSFHPICYIKKWSQARYPGSLAFKFRAIEKENKKELKPGKNPPSP
jgi:hypothetical protein